MADSIVIWDSTTTVIGKQIMFYISRIRWISLLTGIICMIAYDDSMRSIFFTMITLPRLFFTKSLQIEKKSLVVAFIRRFISVDSQRLVDELSKHIVYSYSSAVGYFPCGTLLFFNNSSLIFLQWLYCSICRLEKRSSNSVSWSSRLQYSFRIFIRAGLPAFA